MSNQTKNMLPKDAQVIMSILKELGINDYEPRVINQLLEFTYRYVTCILDDAKVYANHAKKKTIDLDDVKLATQLLLDKSFTTPPPRDVLLELSRTKNNTPLPLIKPHCGLRLPPDRYCLSSCNYKLRGAQQLVKNKKRPIETFANRTNIKARQNQKEKVNITTIRNVPNIPKPNVAIPKPLFKFSTTAKTVTVKKEPIDIKMETIKMEPMDDDMGSIKRKREEDDFEIV